MKTHSAALVAGLAAAALLVPADVWGQTIQSDAPAPASVRRPYRGLFGGGSTADSPHSLVLSGSLFGAYDDNVRAGLTGARALDPRFARSGGYTGAAASLAYHLAGRQERVSYGLASGAGVSAYYFDSEPTTAPRAHVAGNLGIALGRRSSINLEQQALYTKYYRFLLFPSALGEDDDGSLAGDPDVELFARPALRYVTRAGFSQGLGARSMFRAGYYLSYVDFTDQEYNDWRSQGGWVRYDRRLTSHATLNLGYGYRVAESLLRDNEREVHDIDAGVSYSRALSFSRRTSIRMSTGSAIVVTENLSVPDRDPRTRFRVRGNVVLNHEMGRTWTAHVAYNRGLVFREGFDDPFFIDALSAGVEGLVTRRLDLSAVGRYSFSTLDRPGFSRHDSFLATAQARYALGSYVALFARYLYYRYEFGADVPLDPAFARSLARHGVRAGITTSLPLIR